MTIDRVGGIVSMGEIFTKAQRSKMKLHCSLTPSRGSVESRDLLKIALMNFK
jgi:hypothetical protein